MGVVCLGVVVRGVLWCCDVLWCVAVCCAEACGVWSVVWCVVWCGVLGCAAVWCGMLRGVLCCIVVVAVCVCVCGWMFFAPAVALPKRGPNIKEYWEQ